jgi:hypothetical protein
MNKDKDQSKTKKDQSKTTVETPQPPQDMDPSKKPSKGKVVIGDKDKKGK